MKKLLVVLLLAAMVTTPEAAAFGRRGGACGTCRVGCARGNCATACAVCPEDNCPPVRSCPGNPICITPPCADVRKPCEKTECFVEEAPVRAFRKIKTCTVQQAGPVEFDCPITDEIVSVGGQGEVMVGGAAQNGMPVAAAEKHQVKKQRGARRAQKGNM